eukprot:6099185-Karenia_brevis.AAC.1
MRLVITCGSAEIHIISAHAPPEDTDPRRRAAFWGLLAKEIGCTSANPQAVVLLGIDANAH